MSITSLQENLDFCEVEQGYWEITAANDVLVLAYDGGSATNIDVADGTYSGAQAATALQTAIDTAFSISSTVSYSSTTRKFTLDAGSGHTFTYTHSGSDGGLTFGFTDNHSAARTLTSDIAAGDPTAMISTILDSVEDDVEHFCNRIFESASYALQRYDGTGTRNLRLKNYPITALTRLAIGTEDVIKVYNTYSITTASMSVTTTGVVLTRDGTADATLLFADYTTMTTLVTAVNAVGYGWYAAVLNSDFANYKSTELVKCFGLSCIDSNAVNLFIPAEAEDDFEVYENSGFIVLAGDAKFPRGHNNVFVDYTGGYSSAAMPEDLKHAIKILVKDQYRKQRENAFGIKSYSIEGLRTDFEKGMPDEAKRILWKYKRILV